MVRVIICLVKKVKTSSIGVYYSVCVWLSDPEAAKQNVQTAHSEDE